MAISDKLTPAPTPPTRDDPQNFRSRADEFVNWQAGTFVPEINDTIDDFNATIQNLWSATSTTSLSIGTGSKTTDEEPNDKPHCT